jgi:methionyl-tRNA formyltransferase
MVAGENVMVACGNATALQLLEVQQEGRRRMAAADFLRGAHLPAGEQLGLL